jgi:hypothetical protein
MAEELLKLALLLLNCCSPGGSKSSLDTVEETFERVKL